LLTEDKNTVGCKPTRGYKIQGNRVWKILASFKWLKPFFAGNYIAHDLNRGLCKGKNWTKPFQRFPRPADMPEKFRPDCPAIKLTKRMFQHEIMIKIRI